MADKISKAIKIGFAEDFHGETELILRELKDAEMSFEHQIVSSESEFLEMLSSFQPDVVISPYSLKETNAIKLLTLSRKAGADTPFILLAFDLSEDIAIDLLAEGIEDYVQRSTLKRLPVAIRKALQRYKTQLELKISETQLRKSEALLREAQSIAKIGSWVLDSASGNVEWSDEMYVIHGIEKKPVDVVEIRNMIHQDDHDLFDSSMESLVSGKDTTMVYKIIVPNTNDIKYLFANGRVTRDENGAIKSITGTVQDISDRITTHMELERSEASLIAAQKIAKVGSWEWDVGTEQVWWSDEMFNIYEIEKRPITISDVKSFIHPEDRKKVEELTNHDLDDGIVPVIEYKIAIPSGQTKHVVSSAKQVFDSSGKVTRLIGTLQDVTEKVEAEYQSKAEHIQRALTLQASQIGVWHWLITDNQLVWDDRCFEIYEIEKRDLNVQDFLEFMIAEDREPVQTRIAEAFSSGEYRSEYRIKTESGIKYLYSRGKVTHGADGSPFRMDGIIIDMTEHHEMEVALRNSEQLFRDMAESITEVFWLTDWNLNEVLYVSPQYEEMYGQPVADLYNDSKSWARSIHPEDVERATARFRELAITGDYDEEYRLKMKDGTVKWVRDRAFPVFDSNGSVSRVAGITEDITKQKLDQERIETLSLVASETINGVLIHEPNGKVVWANKGFTRITGYEPDEIVGTEPWELMSGTETNQKLVEMTYQKISKGQSFVSDNALTHKDGHVVWVNVTFTPILDDHGNVSRIVSIGMDITKQKEVEHLQHEMLKKLEKANKELKKRASS